MVLLNESRPAAARATRVAWVACLLSAAGCAVFQAIGGGEKDEGRYFPHGVHVVDEGLDCTVCHVGAEDEDEPGMPVRAQCMLCHEESEEGTPPEQRIERFFEGSAVPAAHYTKLPDETVFSHARHVTAGLECSACHGEVGTSERVTPALRLSMDDCTSCHEQRGVANACSTCHSQIGADVPPSTHANAWMETHGRAAAAEGDRVVDRCELCHKETSCTACHQDMRPRSHDEYWRRRGHAVEAKIDRVNCAVCHRPDYCERCHRETLPASHVGSWGSPVDTHCIACHLPLSDNSCIACHKGTPSHAMAAPLPPNHTPGMNCRQCHGLTAPLPHVDNGDDCAICHH